MHQAVINKLTYIYFQNNPNGLNITVVLILETRTVKHGEFKEVKGPDSKPRQSAPRPCSLHFIHYDFPTRSIIFNLIFYFHVSFFLSL